MAGRASIVGAAATHVGKVREHNEDAHFFDADAGVFLVCDGMGGHAAGEVASAIAIRTIRQQWAAEDTQMLIDGWLEKGTPDSKKQLIAMVRSGVTAAHDAIIAEAIQDRSKSGMGTTLVGAVVVGNELVFAHAGDSRAYMVRDGIALQLTEDHTLLARLLAAGIDVDQSGEGSRFRSMLTNALGIGEECKVSTFVVPLADGDRFLLCSDGISEYIPEVEVGEVLCKQPSPARAAQKLIELALERGGADNATAIVVRVLEAGETPQPADAIRRDVDVIASSPIWGAKVTAQQRLRALRIAISRDHNIGERLPAHTLGDRVAWLIVEGKVVLDGSVLEAGAFLYPESLVADSQAPDREGLAVARTDVRALAFRADDFRELCDDDAELGEALLERLGPLVAERGARPTRKVIERSETEHDPETQDAIANAYTKPDEPQIDSPHRTARAASPVSLELEQRFEAVQDLDAPAAAKTRSEREPLILSPRPPESARGGATPIEAAVMTAIAEGDLYGRALTEPEIEIVDNDTPIKRAPGPAYKRPPSAPDIETVIEIEAGSEDSGPVVIGDTTGRIVETIHDTSSATITVTEEVPADGTELKTQTHSRPVTSDETPTASGTINGRAKRLTGNVSGNED